MTLSYADILRALVAATAPVEAACTCWACRRASADLAPIPHAIADAVADLEGWGNEMDGSGHYCPRCRDEWQAKHGDRDDVYHVYDTVVDPND